MNVLIFRWTVLWSRMFLLWANVRYLFVFMLFCCQTIASDLVQFDSFWYFVLQCDFLFFCQICSQLLYYVVAVTLEIGLWNCIKFITASKISVIPKAAVPQESWGESRNDKVIFPALQWFYSVGWVTAGAFNHHVVQFTPKVSLSEQVEQEPWRRGNPADTGLPGRWPLRLHTIYIGWLGSRVVSVLDSGAEGPGFKSQLRRCQATVLGKLFKPIVPLFTKQQNWQQPSRVAGGNCRTGGNWKVMAAYRRVYDSRHLLADCQELGSALEP